MPELWTLASIRMALDIYVGSLTRYYLKDWESAGARVAREMGASYEIVRPQPGVDDAVTDPAVIKDAVLTWRKSLEMGLKQHLADGLSWSEESDAPYFTDRPAYDGYAGLVLLAAHTERPEFPLPDQAVSQWQEDDAFRAVTAKDFKSRFSAVYDVEIWLPSRFPFKFKVPDVAGATVWFGSSVSLCEQLQRLDDETYRGQFGGTPQNPFDQSARFGLEMFLRLARLSVEHKLPMRLDY